MLKIYIPIDAKSLFLNIFNDNKSGHTPTVCTPIKQGRSIHTEVEQIFKIPKQIDFHIDDKLNDVLNKSSKSTTKVTNVFLFDKISINGINVDISDSFCMFVKEEIDPDKVQFGRQKLHYPISIKHSGMYSFDNKEVFKQISMTINYYAFVIKGFYYDFDTDVLDFDADIVGYDQIPYSKIFISNKGTGNKYIQDFHDTFDNYDIESIALKKHFGYDEINPSNYLEKVIEMKSLAIENLKSNYFFDKIFIVSEKYPYALFDIEYRENNIKKYGIIAFSATKEIYFNFSIRQWQFINDFSDYVDFYSVCDIYGNPVIKKIEYDEIIEMNRSIKSICFKK